MADTITVRMTVGSHRPYGGDNPITELGMVAVANHAGNEDVLGDPARAYVTVFVQDEHVTGVQLTSEYDVTFTPVP